jgi:multidrug transporter EmrE-like cation transporter
VIFQWLLFFCSTVVAYIGIALFAQLSGGSVNSPGQAFFSAVRPIPPIVMVVANMFFALAIYYGFLATRFAIPIAIAIGALTSFVYSVVVLGAEASAVKISGLVIAIGGIVLLGL